MGNMQMLEEFRRTHDMGDVYIRDIVKLDGAGSCLVDSRGRRFAEVRSNVWGEVGSANCEILYCGTNRHGGGVMLRPLFLHVGEGCWINSTTGREAPFDLLG